MVMRLKLNFIRMSMERNRVIAQLLMKIVILHHLRLNGLMTKSFWDRRLRLKWRSHLRVKRSIWQRRE